MNILIYNKTLSAGGAERQLVEISRLLTEDRHKVTFLLDQKKGELLNRVNEMGITVVQESLNGNIWSKSRQFRRLLSKFSTDIVLTFLPECNIVAAAAAFPRRRWRLVTGARSANPAYKINYKLRLYYYLHYLSDAVITNSLTNKEDILSVDRFINQDKIKVIYNLIPQHPLVETSTISSNSVSIAVAANYREVKNLKNVLEALRLLPFDLRSRLLIDWYGIAVDNTFIEASGLIRAYGLEDVIRLNPSTRDIYHVYKDHDWVGLFSKYEGLPNSLCEALVMGKPVICTPVSDMPELLAGSGNIVCKGCGPNEIAEGLKRVIVASKSSVEELAHKNNNKFGAVFSPEKIKEKLLKTILG